MNGKCKVEFTNGTIYEGDSLDNRLTGTGVLYTFLEINGKKKKIVLYKGEFCDEQFSGPGTYYYSTGQPWYTGQWKNNLADGYGVMYDETGVLMYRGYFEKGEYTTKLNDTTLFQIQPLKMKQMRKTAINPISTEKKFNFRNLFGKFEKGSPKKKFSFKNLFGKFGKRTTVVENINPIRDIDISKTNPIVNLNSENKSFVERATPIKKLEFDKKQFVPCKIERR
jgi:hypothetical protein